MSEKASYVIGAPWPSGNGICTYMYGGEVQYGTREDANSMLQFVKLKLQMQRSARDFLFSADSEPHIDDYQIYQLVPINSVNQE